MADETKKPQEEAEDEGTQKVDASELEAAINAEKSEAEAPTPAEVAEEVETPLTAKEDAEPVAETPEYADEGEAERLPEPETPLEEGVIAAMEAAEEAAETEAVQAWDSAITSVMSTVETTVEDTHRTLEHSHHSDTVENVPLLGTVTVTGGIYTVVFGALAVLTALEVAVAEFISPGMFFESGSDVYNIFASLKIGVLLAIALLKAMLVVWFYMHLRSDSRVFLLVLLLPLVVVTLSVLYLLASPVQEGLGYF